MPISDIGVLITWWLPGSRRLGALAAIIHHHGAVYGLSDTILALATKRKRDNAVRTQYELKPFFRPAQRKFHDCDEGVALRSKG